LRVLFVYQSPVSFVLRDLDILRSEHQVRAVQFRSVQDTPAVAAGAAWADLTFCWFGKLHAFLGVLFSKSLGKKAIVVAGGDDVACAPEINYGMFAHRPKKWCPLFVFRRADLILSVSNFNRREVIENAKADPRKVRLVYHGFDAAEWRSVDAAAKQDSVLTVGRVTKETCRKKGLDLFVQSAEYLPDIPFILVGPWDDGAVVRLKAMAPPNVRFAGGLYGEQLSGAYRGAKVYVQASVHESFGCSLAEAMLCECMPVVSRRAALPEVVGDTGLYVDTLTPEAVRAVVHEALEAPTGQGKRARERIVAEFPLRRRRDHLLQSLAELVSPGQQRRQAQDP
jgi:glycosyltransferase involved in cell wall biosynthesis